MKESKSLSMARKYLHQKVRIQIDRPIGSKHPLYDFIYPINYGFVPNTIVPDNEALDAYILGVFEPIEFFDGECIAVVHRIDDDDDKLIIVPVGMSFSDAEIRKKIHFVEQFFNNKIIR